MRRYPTANDHSAHATISHSAQAVPDKFGRALGPPYAPYSFRDEDHGTRPLPADVYQTVDPSTASLMPGGRQEDAGTRAELRSPLSRPATAGEQRHGRQGGSSLPPAKHRTLSLPRVPRRPWRLGFEQLALRPTDRAYAGILEALTRERKTLLMQGRELVAPARPPTGDAVDQAQEREARAELALFRVALEDARARSGRQGDLEVAFDSQDPIQDASADLLIQYLVRPGYAEVRTEETEPWQYRYWIRVAWDRLHELAADAGYRLPW